MIYPPTFQPIEGQTVFDVEGAAAKFESTTPKGFHLVYPKYVDYDGEFGEADPVEMISSTPVVWEHIYEEPPTLAYDERIAELKVSIDLYENKLADLSSKWMEQERQHKQRLATLAKYKGLEFIEDFLEGRITHYFVHGNYCRAQIISIESTAKQDYEMKLRMLALRGRIYKREGKPMFELDWTLTEYHDGSGDKRTVEPARSLEEAQALAVAWVKDAFEQWETLPDCEKHKIYISSVVEFADQIHQPVPSKARAFVKQKELDEAKRLVAVAQRDLDSRTALLRKAEAMAIE